MGYQWVIRGLSVGYQRVISRLSEGYQRVIRTAGQFGAQFVHEISPWCGVVVNWVLVLKLEILFLIKPNDA